MKKDKIQKLAIIVLSLSIAVTVIGVMPAAAEVTVTRDLPDTPVGPRDDVFVTLNQSGFYKNDGSVNETLPEGFEYVEGSIEGNASLISYDKTTNELKIQFENETTVKYLVMRTAEQITDAVFSGTYYTTYENLTSTTGDIEGETTLTLAEPTPTPTEVPPSGDGAGGGGGGAPTTPTPTPAVMTPSPGVTPTPAATPTPEGTPGVTPAITPGATPTPSPTPKPLIPGFEAVFAIAGLLAVAYLVMWRRKV